MPFDSAPVAPVTKPIALLRGREALAYLADALDAPMPKGFVWSYAEISTTHACGTVGCAIGLANTIWPDEKLVEQRASYRRSIDAISSLYKAAAFFGISNEQSEAIFYQPLSYSCATFEEVEPQMVAAGIRAFLRVKRV